MNFIQTTVASLALGLRLAVAWRLDVVTRLLSGGVVLVLTGALWTAVTDGRPEVAGRSGPDLVSYAVLAWVVARISATPRRPALLHHRAIRGLQPHSRHTSGAPMRLRLLRVVLATIHVAIAHGFQSLPRLVVSRPATTKGAAFTWQLCSRWSSSQHRRAAPARSSSAEAGDYCEDARQEPASSRGRVSITYCATVRATDSFANAPTCHPHQKSPIASTTATGLLWTSASAAAAGTAFICPTAPWSRKENGQRSRARRRTRPRALSRGYGCNAAAGSGFKDH